MIDILVWFLASYIAIIDRRILITMPLITPFFSELEATLHALLSFFYIVLGICAWVSERQGRDKLNYVISAVKSLGPTVCPTVW